MCICIKLVGSYQPCDASPFPPFLSPMCLLFIRSYRKPPQFSLSNCRLYRVTVATNKTAGACISYLQIIAIIISFDAPAHTNTPLSPCNTHINAKRHRNRREREIQTQFLVIPIIYRSSEMATIFHRVLNHTVASPRPLQTSTKERIYLNPVRYLKNAF